MLIYKPSATVRWGIFLPMLSVNVSELVRIQSRVAGPSISSLGADKWIQFKPSIHIGTESINRLLVILFWKKKNPLKPEQVVDRGILFWAICFFSPLMTIFSVSALKLW